MPIHRYLKIIEIGGWETRLTFCSPTAPLSARLVVLAALWP